MKSIDKLREWSRWLDRAYVTSDGSTYTVYSHKPYDGMKSCGEHMREQCDAIEREIAERYMELPLDADGVPIHVGDNLVFTDHSGREFDVTVEPLISWDPSMYHHYKPRTLEDVLTDFAESIEERGTEWLDVSQTANAIRELMEGDA